MDVAAALILHLVRHKAASKHNKTCLKIPARGRMRK
jgi:hypothetical protein